MVLVCRWKANSSKELGGRVSFGEERVVENGYLVQFGCSLVGLAGFLFLYVSWSKRTYGELTFGYLKTPALITT
jgi:hypothetical protein